MSLPKVGVSACIIGQQVRFDGGHKRSSYVDGQLSDVFDLRPLCPEVGAGMSTPRPTVHLREVGERVRMMDDKNGIDHTEAMQEFNRRAIPGLANLAGYIVCAKSPSCGMERVRVLNEARTGARRDGRGLFTEALMKAYPLLPVEEDGRLNDLALRENFITRVFVYQGYKRLLEGDTGEHELLQFHRRHKLMLMAHNQAIYRELGRYLAQSREQAIETRLAHYGEQLMSALAKPASRRAHTNVLQHIGGYFKRDLDKTERQHLHQTILAYRSGQLPLMAPMTLLNGLLQRFPKPYIAEQRYLTPHPERLALRYHL
ncbi:YbgA family protein [Ferrimonas balearica]|uniref:YbgA family protein n=1 Tax=Ferrimonas balearica TaxID=44012 RepID=UPI001C995EDE|nr:DUF523 and DUF1722 domain-containing protein [Ferrimonas balearica]MBY5992019.1 DUF523 and DUF1722 domain-containing protein [Ferrimonas balearica]